MGKRTALFLLVSAAALFLMCSCKSVPGKNGIPEPELVFEKIDASDPETLHIHFQLKLYNAYSKDARVSTRECLLAVNGADADASVFSLEFPGELLVPARGHIDTGIVLVLRASEYEKKYNPRFDDYELTVKLPLVYSFGAAPSLETEASGQAVFPRIRKPGFQITSIKIMQAELINTRFKVRLQVDNPNHFPVELSSFTYELYGDSRFWAEGEENNVLRIPPRDKAEIDLFLLMNFTNMRRNVLDQVIALKNVRYLFKGNAKVDTGVGYLSRFSMDFEREGHSEVVR